jgi:hypothetical protein
MTDEPNPSHAPHPSHIITTMSMTAMITIMATVILTRIPLMDATRRVR